MMAQTLRSSDPDGERPDVMLMRLVSLSARAVPHADLCGITMLIDGAPTTPAFSDPTVIEVDRGQFEADDGPCLRALRDATVVSLDSVEDDARWPRFNRIAARHGVSAVLSTPMRTAGRAVGVLSVYAREPWVFDAESRCIADTLAAHAAMIITYRDAVELSRHLQEALSHRDVIGQAKGILMAQSGLTDDEAFAVLVRASQRANRKLYEVAKDVAANVNVGDRNRLFTAQG